MKKIFKGITSIIMVAGLIGCTVSLKEVKHGAKIEDVFLWGTSHCIISLILIGVIFIHIWQHWSHIKLILTKNLYLENKLTTLTGILFLLSVISVFLYLLGSTMTILHFHSLIVHIFLLVAVIHLILNFKKLIKLFQKE